MSSCHTSTMLISPKTCFILRSRSSKFRRVLSPIAPKFSVSASLRSVITSGNMIAASAAAVHGAISSAITQVAVTAVAIASGACLDFLWPKPGRVFSLTSPYQIKRWGVYADLYKKVSDQCWFEPGHGDWCTCLERYTLCRDGARSISATSAHFHPSDRANRVGRN